MSTARISGVHRHPGEVGGRRQRPRSYPGLSADLSAGSPPAPRAHPPPRPRPAGQLPARGADGGCGALLPAAWPGTSPRGLGPPLLHACAAMMPCTLPLRLPSQLALHPGSRTRASLGWPVSTAGVWRRPPRSTAGKCCQQCATLAARCPDQRDEW